MKEKDVNTMLVASLQAAGLWAWKVPDMPRGPQTRFVPRKPVDIFAVGPKGRTIAIETKLVTEANRHPRPSDFIRGERRHNQLDDLRLLASHGASVYVAWVVYKPRVFKALRLLSVDSTSSVEDLQYAYNSAEPVAAHKSLWRGIGGLLCAG